MTRPRRFTFDVSGGSTVGVCNCCDWRIITRDKPSALTAAAAHEATAHPGHYTAANQLSQWERRHGTR